MTYDPGCLLRPRDWPVEARRLAFASVERPGRSANRRIRSAARAACLVALLLSIGRAPVGAELAKPAEDAVPRSALSPSLSGRDIYQRVLDNQLATSYMEQRIHSRDPGGYEQRLHFWSRFRDYRVDGQPTAHGVISKSVLKFTEPFDKRESGYLFIEKHRATNDGFHYSRAREKVMRINTAKESIFGTDFTLEDIALVRQIDDARYERHQDGVEQGVPCYVVEAFHKLEADPQYSRSLLWVDAEYFVPLRTRHWDHADFEEKELTAPRGKIRNFDGVWIATESTMRDLAEETSSVLYVDRVDANVALADRLFSPQRLPRLR